jgi:hypothetical protein
MQLSTAPMIPQQEALLKQPSAPTAAQCQLASGIEPADELASCERVQPHLQTTNYLHYGRSITDTSISDLSP